MIAYFEDGTYDPSFNLLDNDYFELVASYWDTDVNIKEVKNILHHVQGPKLKLCGK